MSLAMQTFPPFVALSCEFLIISNRTKCVFGFFSPLSVHKSANVHLVIHLWTILFRGKVLMFKQPNNFTSLTLKMSPTSHGHQERNFSKMQRIFYLYIYIHTILIPKKLECLGSWIKVEITLSAKPS